MDNISHALIGSALIALAPPDTPAPVLWAAVVAAEAPDFDIVIQWFGGRKAYLTQHRGPTHGLAVLPVWAVAIAGVFRLFAPEVGFGQLFWWALLGGLSHVVFDFGNDYGTKGLWPFSNRRIAMDFIPIVDLGLLAIIAGGWLVHWAWPGHRQPIFVFVWILIAAYNFARWVLRRRAWELVAAAYKLTGPCGDSVACGSGWRQEELTVHPTLLSLNAWRYVLEQNGEYLTGMVWVLSRRVGEPLRSRTDTGNIVLASTKSTLVSAFGDWVRRPRVTVERLDGRFKVNWTEMRYEVEGYSPFTAWALLDERLVLVDEGFGKQRPENMDRGALRRRLRLEMGKQEP